MVGELNLCDLNNLTKLQVLDLGENAIKSIISPMSCTLSVRELILRKNNLMQFSTTCVCPMSDRLLPTDGPEDPPLVATDLVNDCSQGFANLEFLDVSSQRYNSLISLKSVDDTPFLLAPIP
jgi:hypothetical protein